jgi:hypothetical protein
LQRVSQIGDQVVAVSHLDGVRGTLLCSFRIGTGAVATHDLNPLMFTELRCKGLCLPIRQEVNWSVRLQVDQDGAVMVSFPPSKIVGAQHTWRVENGRERATQQAQEGPEADWQTQEAG